jgi:hypothetical protein
MPIFSVRMREYYVEEYCIEIEADSVEAAKAKAMEEDRRPDERADLAHADTEVCAVEDAESGEELWNEESEAA